MTQASKLEQQIEQEVKIFNDLHKAHQQFTSDRTSLTEQQNENQMVKKEIDLLEEDAKIYKLTGPVLVPQTLKQTKKTIAGRLDLIKTQLRKADDLIKDNEAKQKERVDKITKLKENYIKLTQQQGTAPADILSQMKR